MGIVLLAVSFGVILAGALFFTNATEWLGRRLELGEGAVGSVLAAVGTAMPETLIPIVAVLGSSSQEAEDVAIGAIIGAPFLLGTLAMAVVGISAHIWKGKRDQGLKLKADVPTLDRDLTFFLVSFALALLAGLLLPKALHIPAAVIFLIAYGLYVRATLKGGGDVQEEDSIGRLYLDPTPGTEPPVALVIVQFVVSLAAIVGGAHLFVEEMVTVAKDVGVEPLVLSLILAPLATELPEKINSIFWVREGKDSLALGNVTGAMVFQSTVPIAVGLLITEWDLSSYSIVSGVLGLIGGGLAYWTLRLRGRFNWPPVIAWLLLFFAFSGYVVLS
jgi:cation:H+ antiporter